MQDIDRFKLLLRKYFFNEISREETEVLFAWIRNNEKSDQLEHLLYDHWKSLQTNPDDDSLDYHKVLDQLKSQSQYTATYRFIWYKIAAAIVLLIMSTFAVLYIVNKQQTEFDDFELAYNPRGEKSHHVLSDGTHVWLNSASSLHFPQIFENQERAVYLEGEAFFQVAENQKVPFVIHTDKMKVQVLGTSFNVSAYPDDEQVSTTLVDGSVSIALPEALVSGQKDLFLSPNQRLSFSKKSNQVKLEKVNTDLYTSWKEGRLVFSDENFETVAKKLERWFNINIDLINGIKDERFTGKFSNESLEQVLEIVNASTPIDFTISGDKIIIKLK